MCGCLFNTQSSHTDRQMKSGKWVLSMEGPQLSYSLSLSLYKVFYFWCPLRLILTLLSGFLNISLSAVTLNLFGFSTQILHGTSNGNSTQYLVCNWTHIFLKVPLSTFFLSNSWVPPWWILTSVWILSCHSNSNWLKQNSCKVHAPANLSISNSVCAAFCVKRWQNKTSMVCST